MENKIPEEYVAELLKQLEELKKKKAHKERKLQKLKGHLKEQITGTSQTSSRKAPDQISLNKSIKNENSMNLHNLEKSISANISLEKEIYRSLTNSKCAKSDDTALKNDKEINTSEKFVSLNFDDHELNKDIKNYSEMEKQKYNKTDVHIEKCIKGSTHEITKTTFNCFQKLSSLCNDSFNNDSCKTITHITFTKPDVNNAKVDCESFVSKKHESSLFNDKLSCSVKKPHLVVENLKIEETVIHNVENIENPICNVKEANKLEELPVNIEHISAPVPDMSDNSKVNNSPQSENKLSDVSSKSLPSSKNKSSDNLDYSLNSNMSFFLSAELFDCNDKKEVINNHNDNNYTSVKCVECSQQTEKVSNLTVSNSKIASPVHTNSSLNGSHQNSFGVFNFPKFSTPTEGNIYQSNNDDNMLDLLGKSQEPKISNCVKDIAYNAKPTHTLNKAFTDILPSENKFDSSQLNFVLEKRLSSVLDAHYESPKKTTFKNKISPVITCNNRDSYPQDVIGESVYKKRKLFTESTSDAFIEPPKTKLEEHNKFVSYIDSDMKLSNVLCKSFGDLAETDQEIINDGLDFDNVNAFDSDSDPFSDLKNASDHTVTLANNSCDDIPSQVTKTVDGLIAKVCEDVSGDKPPTDIHESVNISAKFNNDINENINTDSEILVIPETEGLGLYFSKDTEEFLETSTLSQSLRDFPVNENILNISSQSKLESPVVNNIVAAVKSSKSLQNIHQENKAELNMEKENKMNGFCKKTLEKEKASEKMSCDAASSFDNSLNLDTSFLEDDTQDLGNFKQVPYMNEVNVQEKSTTDKGRTEIESNLNFTCSLFGTDNEPVMDIEIILFSNVKYAVLQHKTHIYVWRQEKNKQWIKIFIHQIEDMFSLVRMCVSMDDDNLVIVMLLSNDEQYCLQFLIFEKDARVIKLMENTHWLEERHSKNPILLCGLNGLMFATAQNKGNPEVSIHAFVSLKENPRLMTAVLGSTDTPLCSLCKIDKLPNALMGISDSMLYVWHIMEARLVTAVPLHPHDYIPIKECFWATVENGLIYFLTTCEGENNHQVCQLLAANLATGFCQSAMTYSTRPSNDKVNRIIKAVYLEPFLVVAHSNGAFIWSVMEEFCCAALFSKSNITSIAISRDFENWGLLAVGSKFGYISCYSLN